MRFPLATLVAGVLALLALAPAAASARTIHVSTHADEDNACRPGSCSLREAVRVSHPGDVVVVPQGTFDLGDQIEVKHELTIRGAGRAATTVDAGGSDRIFFVSGGPVTVRGMTVTGGKSSSEGAGILSEAAERLTLSHVRLTQNSVSQPHFSGTQGQDGGGGVATTAGPLSVLDSKVDHNTVDMHADGGESGVGGGGIYSTAQAIVVRRSEVSANTVIASGSEQGNNPVDHNGGGGIYLYSASMTLDRSTLARNSVVASGNLQVDDNGGGAIYVRSSDATIANSTIAGNTGGAVTPAEDNGGGGLYVGTGTVSLASTTIAGNDAGTRFGGFNSGGAVYDYAGTVSARDAIVAGNTAVDPNSHNCLGGVTSKGHNVEDKDECGFHASGDQPATPIALEPLAFNGGPTRTRAIKQSSPAFDRGAGCPKVDQRGVPRPKGHACDVGAYELAVPNVHTGRVRKVRPHGARLRGTVNPGGAATTFVFRFGKTTSYGRSTKRRSAGAGRKPAAVAAPAGGLSPATIYHYKLVAKNRFGTTADGDRTFITNMELPGGCVRNRRLSFDVERPAGRRVTSVTVRVNGHFFGSFGSSDVKHVRLTKLPAKSFKLSVVAKLDGGGKVRGAHSYSPCSKAAP